MSVFLFVERLYKYKLMRVFFVLCLGILAILFSFPLIAQINNSTLAIIVNLSDQESIEIAEYYKKKRNIPEENVVYIDFKANSSSLTVSEFKDLEKRLNEKVPGHIQAYALAWRKPWRVACMSITSAFSLGFNEGYCAKSCKLTKTNKYYNSKSVSPYTDFNIRPSMMLTAGSVAKVKELIDRGSSSDYTRPKGTAYLLSTNDDKRNIRSIYYPLIEKVFDRVTGVAIIKSDSIQNKKDILFYFTGVERVKWINRNNYLSGAIADHLTSSGGHLFKGKQMSVVEWIDAGVTGSYGAVVEPCNFIEKFPNPGIVMQKYLSGETLLESYWKSVKMPGQGVFVGEPLAVPYKDCKLFYNAGGFLEYSKNTVNNYVEKKSKYCN